MTSTGSNGSNTLATYVYPVMGELPVADVGTAHVLKILEPIWKDKAETASRVRGRMETDPRCRQGARIPGRRKPGALARPYRANPAARSRLSRGHHKAMPYEAIPAFVGAAARA